jgi:hypothetical protein
MRWYHRFPNDIGDEELAIVYRTMKQAMEMTKINREMDDKELRGIVYNHFRTSICYHLDKYPALRYFISGIAVFDHFPPEYNELFDHMLEQDYGAEEEADKPLMSYLVGASGCLDTARRINGQAENVLNELENIGKKLMEENHGR